MFTHRSPGGATVRASFQDVPGLFLVPQRRRITAMRRARRRHSTRIALVILAILSVALSGTARAQDLAAKVEESMEARVRRDRFSGSILVARDGKVLVRRGYGMADREHDVPNTPETKFRLGSVTKQFTAMAVMILQEQGKLDVREKIKKYLPDSPAAWDEITVRHLLTHTAGIPNFTGFADYQKTMRLHTSLSDLVVRFKDRPLEFAPGEKFRYSN